MQALDHAAVELDRAARGVLRLLEGGYDLARLGDLSLGRREDRVAGVDVARMDQRLAVEAEIAALRAFLREAVDIADVAIRPVEDLRKRRSRADSMPGWRGSLAGDDHPPRRQGYRR